MVYIYLGMSDEIGPLAAVVDTMCTFLIDYYCVVAHVEYYYTDELSTLVYCTRDRV